MDLVKHHERTSHLLLPRTPLHAPRSAMVGSAAATLEDGLLPVQQLTFTVALVPADASKVKYQGGVVAEKITESANGVGNLAQAIAPGATFGPVVIYIDQSQQGLPKKATTTWGVGG